MKTLFIASGPIEWASARLRMYWPAEYIDSADVVSLHDLQGTSVHDYEPYNVVVFQKHGVIELQRWLTENGKRVLWDACDPMWWFSPNQVSDLLRYCHGVTVSTQALAADFLNWSGQRAYVVPDSMHRSKVYPLRRKHTRAEPVRFIWYGVAPNRISLGAAWAYLSRLAASGYKISLTLFDNAPQHVLGFGDEVNIIYEPWSLERENEVISAHDIAILPPYPGPWGALKSNNKKLTAWANGLPATDGQDWGALVKLVESPKERQRIAEQGRSNIGRKNTPQLVAKRWQEVLADV